MYQQLIIVGNLGRDPEMKFTPNGKAVCEFSVAVNDRDNTTWYTVTTWEKTAENCYQYLKKGMQVLVYAERIQSDAWVDKQSGEARSKLKVTAWRVVFLSKSDTNAPRRDDEYNEDMPF